MTWQSSANFIECSKLTVWYAAEATQLNNLCVSSNSNLCRVPLSRFPTREIPSPSLSTLSSYVHRIFHGVRPRSSAISAPPLPNDCIWLLRRCATATKAVSLLARPAHPTSNPPTSDCNLLRDENRIAQKIEGTPVFHYPAVGDV